jgi:hypothetical protein
MERGFGCANSRLLDRESGDILAGPDEPGDIGHALVRAQPPLASFDHRAGVVAVSS